MTAVIAASRIKAASTHRNVPRLGISVAAASGRRRGVVQPQLHVDHEAVEAGQAGLGARPTPTTSASASATKRRPPRTKQVRQFLGELAVVRRHSSVGVVEHQLAVQPWTTGRFVNPFDAGSGR
jgi:hypothetical protein